MKDHLSDATVAEVRLLSKIARANDSTITLHDITSLTSASLTETEIRQGWQSIPELSDRYRLEQDRMLPRMRSSYVLAFEAERQLRAEQYVRFAKHFLTWCREKETRLVSISGSTSYYSTLPGDDLDFFTVSSADRLWIFLLKSMILARLYRLLHPGSPRICFSYSTDENYVERAFEIGDPLLARDALNIVVLRGESFYSRLLTRNSWIATYFPRLYAKKTRHYPPENTASPNSTSSILVQTLNLLLYHFMGRYIRAKSILLNRHYRRHAKTLALFTPKVGPDHCIFESTHYSKLRELYNQLGVIIQSERQTIPSAGA